jgi:anti-sigma factor RsiW
MNRLQLKEPSCAMAAHEALLYASGELAGSERGPFERHLAACNECAAAVAEMQAWDRAGQAFPRRNAPVATLDAISAAARQYARKRQTATRKAWWTELLDWLPLRRPVLVRALSGAFALILLAAGLVYFGYSRDSYPAFADADVAAWNYGESIVQMTASEVTSAEYVLPGTGWDDGEYEALRYDLVALAGEIDALADWMEDF